MLAQHGFFNWRTREQTQLLILNFVFPCIPKIFPTKWENCVSPPWFSTTRRSRPLRLRDIGTLQHLSQLLGVKGPWKRSIGAVGAPKKKGFKSKHQELKPYKDIHATYIMLYVICDWFIMISLSLSLSIAVRSPNDLDWYESFVKWGGTPKSKSLDDFTIFQPIWRSSHHRGCQRFWRRTIAPGGTWEGPGSKTTQKMTC